MAYLLLATLTHAQTLKNVLRKTLKDNPQVLSALENKIAAAHLLQQAVAQSLPKLDIFVAQGGEYSNNPATRAFGENNVKLWRSENRIFAEQPLFTGGRVPAEIARGKFDLSSTKNRLHGIREQIALLTSIAYINVLRSLELIEVAKNNLQIHKSTLVKVKKIYLGGAARRSDLELAIARLALAQSRLVNARAEYGLARNEYRAVVGVYPPGKLSYPHQLQDKILPHSKTKAELYALHNNPFLLEAVDLVEVNRKQVKIAKSRFYPNINFELSASKANSLDGIRGRNDDALGLFVLDYNLYNGGGDIARVREAIARVWQQQYDKDQLQLEITQSLQDGWTNYLANQDRIKYLNTYVTYSKAVARDFLLEYTLGQRGLFNVLDADNEAFLA
ncbi:MAG: TolC family protein, partial [Pseudomonadota bacterium]